MNKDLPDKRYFKIGEVSKLACAAPHVIRYWESEFSQIAPRRAASRQRLYRREDVHLILRIKDLLHHQGFTIAGAKKIISDEEQGKQKQNCERAPSENAKRYLTLIKKELLDLSQQLERKNNC